MKSTPIIRLDHFPQSSRLLPSGWLRVLGVYGYDAVEDVILASLVTGDPLLLISKAGTGKTFLLNSLSEAMGIEHRHYNASLIAFDDLVGFPYPMEDGTAIRYIETPARRSLAFRRWHRCATTSRLRAGPTIFRRQPPSIWPCREPGRRPVV